MLDHHDSREIVSLPLIRCFSKENGWMPGRRQDYAVLGSFLSSSFVCHHFGRSMARRSRDKKGASRSCREGRGEQVECDLPE